MFRSCVLLLLLSSALTSTTTAFVTRPAASVSPAAVLEEEGMSSTRLFVGVVGPNDKKKKKKNPKDAATNAILNANVLTKDKIKNLEQQLSLVREEKDRVQDALTAAAGGALLGAGLDVMASQPVDPVVPAALLGTAAFLSTTSNDEKMRNWIGKPSAAVGNFFVVQIKSFLGQVAQRITSLPQQLKTALINKVEQTQADVASWPARLANFLALKTAEAVAQVQRWPQRMAELLQQKAQDAADDLKATPDRMVRMAQIKIDELVQQLDQMGVENNNGMAKKFQPAPPKVPPPADKLRPQSMLFRQFKK